VPITPTVLTLLHSTNTKDERPARFGIEDNIAIGDAFADAVCIDYKHLSMTTFVVFNKGANSLEYKIYGHLDENNDVPPAFPGEWVELPKDGYKVTVAGTKARTDTLTANFAWVLFRMKRTIAGQITTAKVTIRSRQSRA